MLDITVTDLIGAAQGQAEAGGVAEAAALYRDWLARNTGAPLAHVVQFNLGVLLTGLNDPVAALEAFTQAIRQQPGFLPPYINLGVLHERAGALESALGLWQHVQASLGGVTAETIAYKANALKLSAQLLESCKRHGQAEDALRQLVELGPGQRDVAQHWVSLRQRQCKWPLLEPLAGMDQQALLQTMAPLSLANHTDDPLLHLANAWAHCRQDVGEPAAFQRWQAFRHPPGRRLRIGYLSSDLRGHAIGYLTADLFRLHDRAFFEVFAYYNGIPQDDAIKQRIRGTVEHWRDIRPLDDDAALALMLADGIDILVDVNGHTGGARTRLLARRPAPVIVNWLGFPGSMGSPYHHYMIADATIIPPGTEHYFSEQVLRLPCYQPNDRDRAMPAAPTPRDQLGLPADAVVYCSFNGTQKITPYVFARWMEVLRRVPTGILWLLKGSDEAETNLRARAAEAGIAPERLVFAPHLGNLEHLARYPAADLFLDTAPYGAHTTASDALWMGVPVVTLPGRSFASRVCASLVRAAGVPDLVCDTPEAYVALAVSLGQDRARLAEYRRQLLAARHSSALFDTPRCVAALEGLYRGIWSAFENGQLPQPDLTNLEHYLEIGAAQPHEDVDHARRADYAETYRAGLARRHAFSPLPPDSRLWQPASRRAA